MTLCGSIVGSLFAVSILLGQGALSAEKDALPLVYESGFEQGADDWQPTDENAWKVKKTDQGNVYSQFKKNSKYKPPHRSPYNISLLKDVVV